MKEPRKHIGQQLTGYLLLLIASCLLSGCSIPNLEEPDCDQARDVVREFYSRHFGRDMASVPGGFEQQRIYLTPRYVSELSSSQHSVDPFTQTADLPKAFRVGACRVVESGRRVSFELLLFWKTDTRSEEQAIRIDAEKIDGRWLIDRVGE